MATTNNDGQLNSSKLSRKRWTRVRQAYESGELDRQNLLFQSEKRRVRRNALADISAVTRHTNSSFASQQFYQLVERVRELQKEIVPDFLLYELPGPYSPFSTMTPSSTNSMTSIPTYTNRRSISIASMPSTPPIHNQRFVLSPKILERAHDIPERFWLDWQEKQMQDKIEELEYIKNNIGCSPTSSLFSYGNNENRASLPIVDSRASYDDLRRKSLLYLKEAQRLADQRRASLARMSSIDSSPTPQPTNQVSHRSDNDEHNLFNFDQRSNLGDPVDLNDFNESPTKVQSPIVSETRPSSSLDRSRLSISLPISHTNKRAKPIEHTDETIQTYSIDEDVEDIAQIDTELNLSLIKRENSIDSNSSLCLLATINHSIEFRKSHLIPSQNKMTMKYKRKEREDSELSSPTLSFKSAKSRFSPVDPVEEFNNYFQSKSVISSLVSVSHSTRSVSSHIHFEIGNCSNNNKHNHNDSSLIQVSPFNCSCLKNNISMIDVGGLEKVTKTSSSFSYSSYSTEEDVSFSSHELFTCPKRKRRRTKNNNMSLLSFRSTSSSKHNPKLLYDLVQRDTIENNQRNNRRKLRYTNNSMIIFSKNIWKKKKFNSGFQQNILSNDNNDGDDCVIRSLSSLPSSSSVAAATDCFIRRQPRKQTTLKKRLRIKRGTREKKRRKKKERNKKSPSSTIGVEASLFQFVSVDTPSIDTSTIFYPYEQARCAEKKVAKENFSFSTKTSRDYHRQQRPKSKYPSKIGMADGHNSMISNLQTNERDNIQNLPSRRHRLTRKCRKRFIHHSSSSGNSHETIPSSSSSSSPSSTASLSSKNIDELVSLIQKQINRQEKHTRKKRHIIVVNYKPVFINSRQKKSSGTNKPSSNTLVSKQNIVPTDDDFSSATHYSRRRSLTTTSSDGSPLRSTMANNVYTDNRQSFSLDIPDVEDPLMFIEMMYQQLFTEDGQLRNGNEPTPLTDCLKKIVTNSRRNSVSSSVVNGPTSSNLAQKSNLQRKLSSSSSSLFQNLIVPKSMSKCSSPQLSTNNQYSIFSEEDEEPNTLVPIKTHNQSIKSTTRSQRSLKQLSLNVNSLNSDSQIQAFLNSCHEQQTTVSNNTFRFSVDDTDNEDLDTFSDLNSMRLNNKHIRTSPSVEEDLTHTDSRLLSSSGYQSFDCSKKSLKKSRRSLSKSHSENDLFDSLYKNTNKLKSIHYCPNCIRSPNITVIPPVTPPPPSSSSSSSSPSSNIIQRIQQPIGMMLMKYLKFILISKNVLLLPFLIFLLRQRSIHM